MSRLAVILLVVAVGTSSGCATIWTGIQLTGSKTYSTDGGGKQIAPIGDPERQLDVEVLSLSPLSFSCALRERYPRERVTETWNRWGFGWHVVGGFALVTESLLATWDWLTIDGSPRPTQQLATSSYLTLDALATGILLLVLKPESTTQSWEQEGQWSMRARCPDEMSIVAAGEVAPVGADGTVAGQQATAIASAVIVSGAPLQLHWGGRVDVMQPSDAQRCAWARSAGDPRAAAICPPPAPPTIFAPPPYAPPPPYAAPGRRTRRRPRYCCRLSLRRRYGFGSSSAFRCRGSLWPRDRGSTIVGCG